MHLPNANIQQAMFKRRAAREGSPSVFFLFFFFFFFFFSTSRIARRLGVRGGKYSYL